MEVFYEDPYDYNYSEENQDQVKQEEAKSDKKSYLDHLQDLVNGA